MKVNELNPKLREKEAKDLEKKYRDQQKKSEQWKRFKNTVYWEMMMEVIDAWLEDYKDISRALKSTVSPKDFEELGKITVIRTEIYDGAKKLKQKFIDK